jgi:excinuclease ABC subunit C
MILLYQVSKKKDDPSLTARPDLLLIDGGKGQLGVAVDVLKDLGLAIPVASLAKREEEVFVPGSPVSLAVSDGSPARFLLQRIRDEAHRFANDRRERRLDSALFASKLDLISGIGDETKSALLKKFGSADLAIAADDTALLAILTQSQLSALRKRFPKQNP